MDGDCEDGVGTGCSDEGKIYQGQWQDGLPHGTGKLFLVKKKYTEGVWEQRTLKKENPK